MFEYFYMLNAEIKGVKNIDKKVNLSFYKQTVDKSFDMSNYCVKAIFGENGCGKTALITAFSIVRDIVLEARYLSDSNKQSLLEELINKKEKKFEFSFDFILCREIGNTIYRYSIVLLHDESGFYIDNEKLLRKNGNYVNSSFKRVFEVQSGELLLFDINKEYFEFIKNRTVNIIRYQSFLSLYLSVYRERKEIKAYSDDMINLWFCLLNIYVFIGDSDKHDMYTIYKELDSDLIIRNNGGLDFKTELKNRLTNIKEDKVRVELFDFYKTKIDKLTRFIKLFKPDLKNIEINKQIDADFYKCSLEFNYGHYKVDREFESTGIKKLVSVFDAIDAVCHGGIVFIDEFDANINAIYLEKIIEYIIIYGKGQLCFSSHGLEIMDLLKTEKLAIDFLTNDKEIVHWVAKGNNSPINYYKKGFVKGIPYNIDSVDLLDIFTEKA